MPLLVSHRSASKFWALFLASACLPLWAADLKPEEIIAKHLESVGPAPARAAVKSRVVEGGATFRVLVGGSGAIDGKAVVASAGQKSNFLFKINTNDYRGEQFICDGDKTSVAGTHADKSRSELGDFLRSQDVVLREGLLGGVLNTSWPLMDVNAHQAKLSSDGLKKVDGRQLYAMHYKPKKGTDLEIVLYFDPETFQHVMTVYSRRQGGGLGGVTYVSPEGPEMSTGADEISTARRSESRYRIEERFSDFKTTDGLSLPTHYDLRYTQELETGFTKSVEWEVTASQVLNNVSLDARNFQVK